MLYFNDFIRIPANGTGSARLDETWSGAGQDCGTCMQAACEAQVTACQAASCN
jgi:hypothetical protein